MFSVFPYSGFDEGATGLMEGRVAGLQLLPSFIFVDKNRYCDSLRHDIYNKKDLLR